MPSVGRMVKESIVEELSQTLSKRPNVFVTSFNRLSSPEADLLRQYAEPANLLRVVAREGRLAGARTAREHRVQRDLVLRQAARLALGIHTGECDDLVERGLCFGLADQVLQPHRLFLHPRFGR